MHYTMQYMQYIHTAFRNTNESQVGSFSKVLFSAQLAALAGVLSFTAVVLDTAGWLCIVDTGS